MEKIKIFTLTHKSFTAPSDPMYVPLQVGSALHDDLGYLKDDTGDNISEKNIYYSELTGHYWVWKNVTDVPYVGCCHYRRYLMNDRDRLFTESELLELFKSYDIITTKRVHLNNSYRYGFSANHNGAVLDMTGEVIRDLYPSDYDNFISMVNDNYTHFSNMLIASKEIFDDYCSWLFSIFSEVENRVNLDTDEDSYHKRVLGFISEFLLGVYIKGRGLRSWECKVAVMCEKKEVTETKAVLARFFASHDFAGAKSYLLNAITLRPDIMQEASDITGELRMSMQVISTCEFEAAAGAKCILEKISDFNELMSYFSHLNDLIKQNQPIPDTYSEQAVYVAKTLKE